LQWVGARGPSNSVPQTRDSDRRPNYFGDAVALPSACTLIIRSRQARINKDSPYQS